MVNEDKDRAPVRHPLEDFHEEHGLHAFRLQDLLTDEEWAELEGDEVTERDWRALLRDRIALLCEVRETLDEAGETDARERT